MRKKIDLLYLVSLFVLFSAAQQAHAVIGYGGQAYTPGSVAITGGAISGVTITGASLVNIPSFSLTGSGSLPLKTMVVDASGNLLVKNNAGTTILNLSDAGVIDSLTVLNNGSFGAISASLLSLSAGCFEFSNHCLFGYSSPSISSGFGTGASVSSNGSSTITINVGTGGTASVGAVYMATAAQVAWNCSPVNPLTGVGTLTQETGSTTTVVTFTNFTIATDVAVAWVASTIISFNCVAN
jgi:hypothetical protein